MNDLRIVLLLAGVVVLLLLWFIDARRERNSRRQRTVLRSRLADPPRTRLDAGADETPDREPFLGDIPVIAPRPDALSRPDTVPGPALDRSGETAHTGPGFVAVFVLSPPLDPLPQARIFEAARAAGLESDAAGVFHMPAADDARASLFTVANLLEPGTFSRAEDARPTKGLALILPLPVEDASHVLELMLHTAELLAGELGGSLVDASRRPLDADGIERLHGIVAGQR